MFPNFSQLTANSDMTLITNILDKHALGEQDKYGNTILHHLLIQYLGKNPHAQLDRKCMHNFIVWLFYHTLFDCRSKAKITKNHDMYCKFSIIIENLLLSTNNNGYSVLDLSVNAHPTIFKLIFNTINSFVESDTAIATKYIKVITKVQNGESILQKCLMHDARDNLRFFIEILKIVIDEGWDNTDILNKYISNAFLSANLDGFRLLDVLNLQNANIFIYSLNFLSDCFNNKLVNKEQYIAALTGHYLPHHSILHELLYSCSVHIQFQETDLERLSKIQGYMFAVYNAKKTGIIDDEIYLGVFTKINKSGYSAFHQGVNNPSYDIAIFMINFAVNTLGRKDALDLLSKKNYSQISPRSCHKPHSGIINDKLYNSINKLKSTNFLTDNSFWHTKTSKDANKKSSLIRSLSLPSLSSALP
jgi:hypothetical protein